MDHRTTSLILMAALAGTGNAQAGNVPGDFDMGFSGGADHAVSQLVGFMLAADENPAVRIVDAGNLDTGSNPDAGTFVVGAHNFAFDGSSISEMLSSVRSEQMSLDGITDGSWHVSIAPTQGVFGDAGGLVNPTVIPLPAPVAMGGIGLLSLGGFAAWKRRVRG